MIDLRRQYFCLVKDQRKTFNDPGGIYEQKHKRISSCAAQELKEETRGLVKVSARTLQGCKWVDVPCGRHMYRMYIMYVNSPGFPSVSCSNFYKINPKTLPKAYQETTRMTWFPIRQFKSEYLRNGHISSTKNTDRGKKEKVHGRVRTGIASAIQKGLI